MHWQIYTYVRIHLHTHPHARVHSNLFSYVQHLSACVWACMRKCANTCIYIYTYSSVYLRICTHMGWLRLASSLELKIICAEYRLFYRALLQKRPVILRSLLVEATPYFKTKYEIQTCLYTYIHTHTWMFMQMYMYI